MSIQFQCNAAKFMGTKGGAEKKEGKSRDLRAGFASVLVGTWQSTGILGLFFLS